MSEGITVVVALNGVTIVLILAVLGFLAKWHKIGIRMIDRVNTLWDAHTKQTGERFVPLENGK